MSRDLLIEIGTEELPPKALKTLADALLQHVTDGLDAAGIGNGEKRIYATPRRLALLIANVPDSQPDREIERKGPAVKAAYDADGNPTKALRGFMHSCGATPEQLDTQETDKGAWLLFRMAEKGQPISTLVPGIVDAALAKLPIPKRMRWGASDVEFVRPVHWIVLMHGSNVIDGEVLGIRSSNRTRGHRFHANNDIELADAGDYAARLKADGYVIADMVERVESIREQAMRTATELGGNAVINDDLLAEVAALTEWPVAVAGEFEAEFLSVPAEALIRTMQDNQKYFPVVDANNTLKNLFITISNIDSTSPDKVRAGNERVVRPRLADAKFFWEKDQKQPLEAYIASLDNVVFQTKLGSLGEKSRRVALLAKQIAVKLGADEVAAERAALLSKCDLMTDMVGEFPTLQGVMGKRYAQACGETEAVALALDEQYKPRHAGDSLPQSTIGQVLAISDKLDTLVGIFAIGQKPTGEKDPYALRRAALGVLRIMIECRLDLDLAVLIRLSAQTLAGTVDTTKAVDEVFDFMLERLRAYYLDRGVSFDVFDAVSALRPGNPLDFDQRIKAVQVFRQLPEAESLATANKRVRNILKKAETGSDGIDESLLQEQAEQTLYQQLQALKTGVENLFDEGEYELALTRLSVLRTPVDAFFDSVMVMTDDEALRRNRIALLNQMSQLFLHAADLSLLQQPNPQEYAA